MQNSFLRLFIVVAVCVFSMAVKAQGNLQFNRAINYNLTATTVNSTTRAQQSITVTVPAGKVWKIESYHLSYAAGTAPTVYFLPSGANFDGNITIDQAIVSTGTTSAPVQQTAIWLPAGNHTIVLQGYANSNSPYIYYGLVTGIEFNITQ